MKNRMNLYSHSDVETNLYSLSQEHCRIPRYVLGLWSAAARIGPPACRSRWARQAVAEQYQALCMDERKPSPHPRLRGLRAQLYGGHGQVIPYFKDVDAFDLTELSDFCNTFLNAPLTADTPVNRIEDRLVNEISKEYWTALVQYSRGRTKERTLPGKRCDAANQIDQEIRAHPLPLYPGQTGGTA